MDSCKTYMGLKVWAGCKCNKCSRVPDIYPVQMKDDHWIQKQYGLTVSKRKAQEAIGTGVEGGEHESEVDVWGLACRDGG